MRAHILKRLAALEEAALARATPPIRVIEVLNLTDDQRARFRAGDPTLWPELGVPASPVEPGMIHTVVIDVPPDWLDDDLDPDDLDRIAQQEIYAEAQRGREAERERERVKLASMQEQRTPALIGYDMLGRPIFSTDSPDRQAERVPGT